MAHSIITSVPMAQVWYVDLVALIDTCYAQTS